MNRRSTPFWLSILAASAIALQSIASAQESSETIKLTVGDILEIIPVHSLADAQYAWILTQDRSFLQAERSSAFRTRLIQPGNYLLVGEVSSTTSPSTLRRTFRLEVAARETAVSDLPTMNGSGAALVTTEPRIQADNHVVLAESQQTIRLIPVSSERTPLSLDLDTSRDTNGDGQAGNDVDNEGTFFQLDATPIFVWFAEPLTERAIAVTTVGPDGGALVQSLAILSFAYAKEQGLAASPGRIVPIPQDGATFEFSVAFDTPPTDIPLLYHWQFGDDSESLVSRPVHTYQTSGDYTVTVSVRNLVTGREMANYTTGVQAKAAPPAATGGETPPTLPTNDQAGGGMAFSMFLWPLALLLGVLILGAVAYLVLRFLRGRKPLHETLAQMEETIVPKETPAAAAPPPLVIESRKEATKDRGLRTSDRGTIDAAQSQVPPTAGATAPVWLKKGMEQTTTSTTPPPPPAPPKPIPPPPPKPVPTPAPAPPTTPTPSKDRGQRTLLRSRASDGQAEDKGPEKNISQSPTPSPQSSATPPAAPTKPGTPATPAKAPSALIAAPKPAPSVVSETNKAQDSSAPLPSWLQQPSVTKAPEKPVTPPPPPAPPKPVTPPKPTTPPPPPTPPQPTASRESSVASAPTKTQDSTDPTIAVIRAESIEDQQKKM